MNVPLFINSVHLAQDPDHFLEIPLFFVQLYIYVSTISNIIFCYTAYLNINPQIKEKSKDWLEYVRRPGKIRHFQMFEGYHPSIDPESWRKRNYLFFHSASRIILMIFVGFSLIEIPNLLFQVLHLIYLFTVRPFRYDFFNFANITMQIFIVLFYLYSYIVSLYTAISEEVTTSYDIENILLSYIVLVCMIIFVFFCLGLYEFYERIKFFKISMNYFNSKEKEKRDFKKGKEEKSKIMKNIEKFADKLPK